MFYYAALTLTKSKNHPDLIDFYAKNTALFEVVNAALGSGSSLNAAARAMKTNVLECNYTCPSLRKSSIYLGNLSYRSQKVRTVNYSAMAFVLVIHLLSHSGEKCLVQ
jgi:hypothetical protein